MTGTRPTNKEDFGNTNFIGWVKMKAREGKEKEVTNQELIGTDKREEMVKYPQITLRCVNDFPWKRPCYSSSNIEMTSSRKRRRK